MFHVFIDGSRLLGKVHRNGVRGINIHDKSENLKIVLNPNTTQVWTVNTVFETYVNWKFFKRKSIRENVKKFDFFFQNRSIKIQLHLKILILSVFLWHFSTIRDQIHFSKHRFKLVRRQFQLGVEIHWVASFLLMILSWFAHLLKTDLFWKIL